MHVSYLGAVASSSFEMLQDGFVTQASKQFRGPSKDVAAGQTVFALA